MRCEQCNKFVSFDTDNDPEVDITLEAHGGISGSVRIVNTCAECGTEMKEGYFDVDGSVEDEFDAHKDAHKDDPVPEGQEPVTHELDESGVEESTDRTEQMETKDRKGKAIRNPRYQKHLYGYEMTVTARCSCGEEFTTTISDEMSGSEMD